MNKDYAPVSPKIRPNSQNSDAILNVKTRRTVGLKIKLKAEQNDKMGMKKADRINTNGSSNCLYII